MAQSYDEPRCAQTGKPFYPAEKQLSESSVGVYCSECDKELEVYAV